MILGTALAIFLHNLSGGSGSEGETPKVEKVAVAQHAHPGFQSDPQQIKAQLHVDNTLEKNKTADFSLVLENGVGDPVNSQDLMTVHSEKLHVFVIDESLSDYFHGHPVATQAPGTYQFSMTPHNGGHYKVFVELTPTETATTQYLPEAFTVAGVSEQFQEREQLHPGRIQLTNEQAGLIFTAKVDRLPIKADQANQLWITISDSKGTPFTELEPIMGAYAHIAGFNLGREHIAHFHPVDPIPYSLDDRGGPDLLFHFNFSEPGYHRLFIQVQVAGQQLFMPFDVSVV